MMQSKKHFRKRDAILTCLQQSKAHPSAETIFTQLKPQIPDLSMGTVYRNLSLFKQQGLAASIATVNGTERFDGNTAPHVHFLCTACDAVIDLEEMAVPETLSAAAQSCSGGSVQSCSLSFTGLCRECLKNNQKSGEAV